MKTFVIYMALHLLDYAFSANDNRICRRRSQKCVHILDCPSKIELMHSGKRPDICGFEGYNALICCDDDRKHEMRPPVRDSYESHQDQDEYAAHRDYQDQERDPYNHSQSPTYNGNRETYSQPRPGVNQYEYNVRNHGRDPHTPRSTSLLRDPYDRNVFSSNRRSPTANGRHSPTAVRQKHKFGGNTPSVSGSADQHTNINGGDSNLHTSNDNQYDDSPIRPLSSSWQNEVASRPQNKPHTQGPLTKRDQYDGTFMRVCEKKCREYSSQVTEDYAAIPLLPNPEPMIFTAPKCQYDGVPLIVGGQVAAIGEFPHMAAIGYKKRDSGYAFSCGGSLISENFVLTAAHCATNDRDNTLSRPEPQIVRLGEQNLVRDDDGAEPIDVNIVQIIKHPEYKPPKKYHDIALLKLENDIVFSLNIRPACLWSKPTIENKNAVATGWGQIDFAEDQSDDLLKVVVDVIDQQTCRNLYSKTIRRKLPQGITNDQLCAGSLEGGRDTCGGDSGGPLQIPDTRNKCVFYLIGITAFGVGCGIENTAGVYERISSNVPWIEGIVWPGHH